MQFNIYCILIYIYIYIHMSIHISMNIHIYIYALRKMPIGQIYGCQVSANMSADMRQRCKILNYIFAYISLLHQSTASVYCISLLHQSTASVGIYQFSQRLLHQLVSVYCISQLQLLKLASTASFSVYCFSQRIYCIC